MKISWHILVLSFFVIPLSYSCSTSLELNSHPKEVVEFYLLDHGRHSSLLFPPSKGDWIEFTYGEWEWFAQNNDPWYRVPGVLFWPTKGALGHRTFSDLKTIKKHYNFENGVQLILLRAERRLLENLRERLEKYFIQSKEHAIFNHTYQLNFVPHKASFHLFHMCNHQIRNWLEELNYDVSGWTLYANWEVKSP